MGALAGLESARSEGEIRRMVGAFGARRDVMVAGLNGIPGVRCHEPGGAFYVFPNIAGLCEDLGVCDAFASLPDPLFSGRSASTSQE